jgi:hypothetical protein
VVDKELFIAARRLFTEPAQHGHVLGDIMRRLAMLGHDFTEAKISTEFAGVCARSLRSRAATLRIAFYAPPRAGEGRERAKPTISARLRAKPSPKAIARRKGVRSKP